MALFGNLIHCMRRCYDDRTQRRYLRSLKPFIIHRNAEKSGYTQGFDSRVQFFQMTTETFLAFIHAHDDLRFGPVNARDPVAAFMIGLQRMKQFVAIMMLVSN